MKEGPLFFALEIQRRYSVDVETLFAAWSNASELALWAGLSGASVDFRVGGWFSMSGWDGPAAPAVRGEFLEIEPPHLLTFTWMPATAPPTAAETFVSLRFAKRPEGSELHMRHLLHNEEARAARGETWHQKLDLLSEHLTARTPV
jgi:uncharacterized protein YndB with AHSA1/START domain